MMILPPQAQAGIAVALLVAGFFAGVKVTSNHHATKQLTIERKYQEELAKETAKAQAVAQKYEDERTNVQEKFRTITKEVAVVVDRPVYRQCRLDADGLRLWNEANEGPGPTVPDAALPEAPEAP